MKKFLFKFWPVIICLIFAALVAWPAVIQGYFSHHDDLQVMRIFEMRKCLQDYQIPCRWVPDMGYGNGYPLFNYYAVFPYYLGAFFSFLLGFLTSAKLLFMIPIFLGAVSMFVLANGLFGVYPGILASVLYTYTPYHALDLYVRGDVSESFAVAIIPLVFYFALKLIKLGGVRFLIGLSLSLAVFLTSHNIMTVLFMPVFLLMILYWLITINRKNLLLLIFGLLLGVGLSVFFILPAYLEKNLVQIDNLIKLDLNFRAHFTTINQLFLSRYWGYGASVLGPGDTISFQIGWPHWWIAGIAILTFLVSLRLKKTRNFLPVILFIIFLFSIFMTHTKSAFIWEKIEILKFTQFPWRFLAVATLATSLLGGYFVQIFGKNKKYAALVLIIITVVLNWNYFRPKEFYFGMTDQSKLSGKMWDDQRKAAILDYLPKTAVEPREPASSNPLLKSGDAKIGNFVNKSNSWQFQAQVTNNAVIEVPVFDFPKWEVTINGSPTSFSNKNYLGRIDLNFQKSGQYSVSGKFTDTPIRMYSNIISLFSLLCLIVIGLYGKNNKNFR